MKHLILIVSLCLSMTSLAGDKGNGGDGVYSGGKLYLLDLFEAGMEKKGHVDRSLVVKPLVLEEIESNLSNIPNLPQELLGQKITEVINHNYVVGSQLLSTIKFFDWQMINYKLDNIEDENTPVTLPLQQIAIRIGTSILINSRLWNQLDSLNKAALIIHEMVYANVKPVKSGELLVQVSYVARKFVSGIFSKSFNDKSLSRLIVGTTFPRLNKVTFGYKDSENMFNFNPSITLSRRGMSPRFSHTVPVQEFPLKTDNYYKQLFELLGRYKDVDRDFLKHWNMRLSCTTDQLKIKNKDIAQANNTIFRYIYSEVTSPKRDPHGNDDIGFLESFDVSAGDENDIAEVVFNEMFKEAMASDCFTGFNK